MSIEPGTVTGVRPYTGEEYLESLRDGREVWLYGERVEDVTTHPAFRNSARSVARLYDALHDPARRDVLTAPTDTGNGGFTHPFFKTPRSKDDLRASRDAIRAWQEMGYGFMGRTPDYKASFLGTLGANSGFYADYEENAQRWYRMAQERVMYLDHAIVHPPVDRHRSPDEVADVYMHVDEETDAGLIVSGAKMVATNAALTQANFVAHYGAPVRKDEFGLVFALGMDTPGVKLVARQSYEYQAATVGSPFDYPLSSRLDENDSVLILDRALVPWEDVFCYGAERANAWMLGSGFVERLAFQAVVRFTVKLEFFAGLLEQALKVNGTDASAVGQEALGEVLMWRNLFAGLTDGMIENARPWTGDALQPDGSYGVVYLHMASQAYVRIRQIVEETVGSNLIYLNSNAADFASEQLRPVLDRFYRGSHGMEARDRVKIMKLFWDALGSEFGSRHELYELNYGAPRRTNRMRSLWGAQASGLLDACRGMVERCMGEYDLDGWTAPDLIAPDDVSLVR